MMEEPLEAVGAHTDGLDQGAMLDASLRQLVEERAPVVSESRSHAAMVAPPSTLRKALT